VIVVASIYHSSRVPPRLRSSAGIIARVARAGVARAVVAGAVLAGAVLAISRRGTTSSDVHTDN
jgi:hypothetical protein